MRAWRCSAGFVAFSWSAIRRGDRGVQPHQVLAPAVPLVCVREHTEHPGMCSAWLQRHQGSGLILVIVFGRIHPGLLVTISLQLRLTLGVLLGSVSGAAFAESGFSRRRLQGARVGEQPPYSMRAQGSRCLTTDEIHSENRYAEIKNYLHGFLARCSQS